MSPADQASKAREGTSGATISTTVSPALECLRDVLPETLLSAATDLARRRRTCPFAELVAGEAIEEDVLYRRLAASLDLPFEQPRAGRVLPATSEAAPARPRIARTARPGGGTRMHLAPDAHGALWLAARRDVGPLPDLAIATPTGISEAMAHRGADRWLRRAVHGLWSDAPRHSARTIATGGQGFWLALAGCMFAALALRAPGPTLLAIHFAFSALFLACGLVRLAVALGSAPPVAKPVPEMRIEALPRYTLLVALHREAAVLPQLIAHLDALEWPRTRLDIQLVCEADDRETLDAIEAHGLPPHMRVVRVPPGGPRTKPKALNHALAGSGEGLLALYDAEDRPHPEQLREAYHAFRDGPANLACVQAPLEIDNGRASFMARGFALEYAALFRGFLPWLARHGLPVPLGGTSNHFRVDALRAVGAWDPYNVTEDADLGFRLAKAGLATAVITRPTIEAAPETFSVWLPQRTRWLKGWMQTWLVHMREIGTFRRRAGWAGIAMLQLLTLGMVASALFHPIMLVSLLGTLALLPGEELRSGFSVAIATFDLFAVSLGYLGFWALGRSVLAHHERWLAAGAWWRLPCYWMALGVAAWRAAWQLCRDPHRWEKTPHMPSALPVHSETEVRRSGEPDDAAVLARVGAADQHAVRVVDRDNLAAADR